MQFDLVTIARVHRRLRDRVRHPLLLSEAHSPARLRVRIQRVKAWCGPGLWFALDSLHNRGELPTAGTNYFRRSPRAQRIRSQSVGGWAQ